MYLFKYIRRKDEQKFKYPQELFSVVLAKNELD